MRDERTPKDVCGEARLAPAPYGTGVIMVYPVSRQFRMTTTFWRQMSDLVSGTLPQVPKRPNFACHYHDDQCLLVGRKLFLTGLRQFLHESALDGKSPKKHCQSKRTLSSYSVTYLINLLLHSYPTRIW